MDSCISVGAKIPKKHIATVASGIVDILKAGSKAGADQATIQLAIENLVASSKVENVTINGCNFTGVR